MPDSQQEAILIRRTDGERKAYTQGFEQGWQSAMKFVAEDRLGEAEDWFQSIYRMLNGIEP